jgi:hypothetical protein
MDSNMVHHQNLAQFRIAVIPLQAQSNRLVGKITRWPDRDLF